MGHQITNWNISHKLQKRKLLVAVNIAAGIGIFFFGYDQGVMGGVNNAKAYIDIMGFGHTVNTSTDRNVPVITDTTLQGGINSVYYFGALWGALFGGGLETE